MYALRSALALGIVYTWAQDASHRIAMAACITDLKRCLFGECWYSNISDTVDEHPHDPCPRHGRARRRCHTPVHTHPHPPLALR